ncbi:MT-A70 family methyltransferase [Mucilaginibacter ginsenosidivorax]|nr:MT-A70 family methyltransferase [Mucilaginibacter ginsenosidivorax]
MKHEVIMICPPWKQYRIYRRSHKILTGTISPKMVKAMVAFQFLGDCLEYLTSPDHIVFIWVTEKFADDCRDYMKHLGYQYHQYLAWQRPKWKRGTSKEVLEYLMVYYKGALFSSAMTFPDPLKSPFTGRVKNRKYKPADAYALIESIFPNRSKLQVFGSTRRPGWNVFLHKCKK